MKMRTHHSICVFPAGLKDCRGMTFVELMASVTMMSIVSLGLIIILLAMSKQMVRDKYINDMNVIAQMVLDEAVASMGNANSVAAGSNAGFTVTEKLEFNIAGGQNLGRSEVTRFRKNSDYRFDIRNNFGSLAFCDRWPPKELDPDVSHETLDRTIKISSFRVHDYSRRLFVSADVVQNLQEIKLTMEYAESSTGFSLERDYSRVVFTANPITATRRLQSASDGS